MENHSRILSPKSSKLAYGSIKNGARNSQSQPFNLHTEQRGQRKEQQFVRRMQAMVAEEAKRRVHIAQGLPLTTEKPQNLPKPAVKEQTKPVNIRLHTEERATQRAGYNHLVARKIYSLEILRRFEEKLLKVIEDEEIKNMRKEMVPKAQLMPIFDRPFFPQRSSRPPTVPREPCFHFVKQNCSMSGQPYKFNKYLSKSVNESPPGFS